MKKIILSFLCIISLSLFSQEVLYNLNQVWVTDLEDILTTEEEQQINKLILDYEQKTTCEIAILTTSDYEDFGDISEYAFKVGEKWGVGKKDIDNGLMIIISKTNDENFVATGYGLEGYLPDITTHQLQDTFFVPYFDEGKYYEGITLFIDACFKQIGDEYSADDNESKQNENLLSELWLWFVSLPLWIKIGIGVFYVLWWIIDPISAWYFTLLLLTFGQAKGGMGGGKFGGGGSRS